MYSEELLQFIWKQGLFGRKKMRTTWGKHLEILDPEIQNFNAGPDFFNARIYLDQLLWAGNVEIHLNSSDWTKHNHHLNPAYDNVILHVVDEFDGNIRNSRGRQIPTLILDLPEQYLSTYHSLNTDESCLPCGRYIKNVPAVQLQHWMMQLQTERMGRKIDRISRILSKPGTDSEETIYRAMASGFGLTINSLPFEIVSSGIPLKQLMNLRDCLPVLEAILFGQSGFLDQPKKDGPYATNLLNIYREQAEYIPGEPVPRYLWKFLRLRPASFPTLRLSQFASLLHHKFPLAESLLALSSSGYTYSIPIESRIQPYY